MRKFYFWHQLFFGGITGEYESVQIFGEKLYPGVYDSSLKLEIDQLENFMEVINEKGIKKLNFSGCELSPAAGIIIGNALKKNKFLERLEVNSNQLDKVGMSAILTGLMSNQSLKILHVSSYNMACYYFSSQELELLANLVSANSVLEKIELPDNQLMDFSDINCLSAPYHSITDRTLAIISGLSVSKSAKVPDFCRENLDVLDELSTHRFSNRHYS